MKFWRDPSGAKCITSGAAGREKRGGPGRAPRPGWRCLGPLALGWTRRRWPAGRGFDTRSPSGRRLGLPWGRRVGRHIRSLGLLHVASSSRATSPWTGTWRAQTVEPGPARHGPPRVEPRCTASPAGQRSWVASWPRSAEPSRPTTSASTSRPQPCHLPPTMRPTRAFTTPMRCGPSTRGGRATPPRPSGAFATSSGWTPRTNPGPRPRPRAPRTWWCSTMPTSGSARIVRRGPPSSASRQQRTRRRRPTEPRRGSCSRWPAPSPPVNCGAACWIATPSGLSSS